MLCKNNNIKQFYALDIKCDIFKPSTAKPEMKLEFRDWTDVILESIYQRKQKMALGFMAPIYVLSSLKF